MPDHNLRLERMATPVCLLIITALAWAYLLMGAGTMQEMDGMVMAMSVWPWTASHAALMFVMWLVMMTAMMLPSAAPVILLYRTISRRNNGRSRGASGCFVLGYLAVWGGFSLLALVVQYFLERAELLSPMMESTNTGLSGALLIAAGIYQFTPLKRACLRLCRSPLEFFMAHWRSGKLGAFAMGTHHGIYCVACCWGLMLLLFVGGVMNLMWIVGLAIFVLIEKLVPAGQWMGQAGGVLLTGAGAVLVAVSLA